MDGYAAHHVRHPDEVREVPGTSCGSAALAVDVTTEESVLGAMPDGDRIGAFGAWNRLES